MFNIGDIIKRKNGKTIYEVIRVRSLGNRFGDMEIKNLDTGRSYWAYSNLGNFVLTTKDIIPKVLKNIKFKFK